MATFFTSDLHFGHQNIISYTGRPYSSVDEMNHDLIERYNFLVLPSDTVYFLGDVCMGKLDESLECIALLNGTKVLIPGNHDRMFRAQGTKYRNTVQRYLDAGFSEVLSDQVTDTFSFGRATLCHFPPEGESQATHEDRYQDYQPSMPPHGALLHGHLHGHYAKRGRLIDVGVDAQGGFPISETRVAELLASSGDLSPVEW